MRQIKFDAIYKPTGEHFTPVTLDFNNNQVTGNFDGEENDWCYFSLDGSNGDVILREYTGLKDSKGVEIYDGDIVIRHKNGSTIMETVKYGNSAWLLIGKDGKTFLENLSNYCEVLRNIYEN